MNTEHTEHIRTSSESSSSLLQEHSNNSEVQKGDWLAWWEEDGHFCVVKGGTRPDWQ